MDSKNPGKRYYELAEKWLNGTITREEEIEFSNWYNIDQDKEIIIPEEFAENDEMLRKRILQNILDTTKNKKNVQSGRIIQFRQKNKRSPLVRIAVAASIIGVIILGSYFWVKKDKKNEVAKTQIEARPYKNDVLPGGNKAMLTLADGSTILLEDAQNGALAQQGGTKIIKLGGKLSYSSMSAGSKDILYNTVITPRGGQYQVELSDGSQVWLNAASSLRFPTAFAGKERRVEITGEAYFEVAKNKNIPFIVSVNGAEVQVLGTHFNVMAYTEEDAVKTTLLEGSVLFSKGKVNRLLKPGQQSELSKNDIVKVNSNVDVNEVVAWKNGKFHFENADLETIMRQLSRWYNIEIIYDKKVNDLFYLEMSRSSNLSNVLKALELAGDLHFEIIGKAVILKP
jgi:ferric-dicitrate binding protein FerR (iron transport regulator)